MSAASEHLESYLQRVTDAVAAIDVEQLAALAKGIEEVATSGGEVFFIGNGGSAATATHYVNDLVMAFARTGRSIRATSMSDNVALVTGVSNDYSFDEVFEYQLQVLARPGDLVIAISASGNSPNLVRAVAYASGAGIRTAAVIGFDGGALRDLVEFPIFIPTARGDYGPAEDAHLIVNHALASLLRWTAEQ